MFSLIKYLIKAPRATSRCVPVPKMRNMIWDIMDEGRRKNTIHLTFDADLTAIHEQMAKYETQTGKAVTLTSYIAKVLADCVAAEPEMHAYLNRKKEFVLFEDVDLSVMIERKVEGSRMPVPYIVRAANKKHLLELDEALRNARTSPLYKEGPISELEAQFFSLPRFMRKLIWYFIRRDPHLFKDVAGTVGITSMPIHSNGREIGLPISPMTLTLLVGAISSQIFLVEGKPVERKIIQMNLSADHNIIDGAQLMRFFELFKKRLAGSVDDLVANNLCIAAEQTR